MLKVLCGVMLMAAVSWAQLGENWSGYGDTATLTGFRADSTKYTGWFRLSTWENLRVTCYANDTSVAGFAADSVKFAWGIQTAHPAWISTPSARKYCLAPKLTVDTMNLIGSIMVPPNILMGSDYTFTPPLATIDTANGSGYAYQTRQITPEWDVYFRFWATGVAGNKITKYPKVIFEAVRRSTVPVGSR